MQYFTRGPVLELACGRGEFLELLRDEGLSGRGVDLNAAMAKACRERELECTAENALSYLARQDGIDNDLLRVLASYNSGPVSFMRSMTRSANPCASNEIGIS